MAMGTAARREVDAPASREVGRAVASLFPASAATAVTPIGEVDPPGTHPEEAAYREERAAVAGAAPRRRAEFAAGRASAHAALAALGRDGLPVGRGTRREPRWPEGVVGSICHAGHLAAAVAAPARQAWGVGLDMEPADSSLDAGVQRLVLTSAERARPRSPSATTMAFCVKEATFKCVFPATGWLLDFHDVSVVEVDPVGGRCRAVVDERFRVGGAALPPLEGRVAVAGGFVLAGLWVASLTA